MKKRMNLTNIELRKAMHEKGLHGYELARMCAVTPITISRWLSTELPDEKKEQLLQIIERA